MDRFKKLMREQVQKQLADFRILVDKPVPGQGWLKTIREALGMTSAVLAKRVGCSRTNIIALEKREKEGTITLNTLEQVARAMDCTLVYCLVPKESLERLREIQARAVAKKRVNIINHSMLLEQQGLRADQLKQQEDELVQELLQGDSGGLWSDDEM